MESQRTGRDHDKRFSSLYGDDWFGSIVEVWGPGGEKHLLLHNVFFFFFWQNYVCMYGTHMCMQLSSIYLPIHLSIHLSVFIIYLFIYISSHLSIHPSIYLSIHLSTTSITRFTIHPLPPPFPPWYPNVCFLCLCFYFHFANRFICTTYLGPLHMH